MPPWFEKALLAYSIFTILLIIIAALWILTTLWGS